MTRILKKNDLAPSFFHKKMFLIPIPFFIILIFLSIVYFPCISSYYAFHDELSNFEGPAWRWDKIGYHEGVFTSGRFIGAYVGTFCSFFINRVYDLNVFRFITVVFLSFSTFLVYGIFYKRTNNPVASCGMALLIFTLPSFSILVATEGLLYNALAVLLAVFAAYLFDQIDEHKTSREILCEPKVYLSMLVQLTALLCYASTAMMFWILPVIYILFSPQAEMIYRKHKIYLFACAGLGTILIYAGILSVAKSFLIHKIKDLHNPFILTNSISGKVEWFFHEPLLNALNLWNIFPDSKRAIAVLVFILVGFFAHMLLSKQKGFNGHGGGVLRGDYHDPRVTNP